MKDGKLKELTGKEVEEMRDKKPLPIGIDDFKTIIEEDYYYADKTKMIESLLDDGAGVTLFTRPRRFGKTLNMSMLNYFFNLKNKEENRKLFENLYISKSKYMNQQGEYPVIYLSFKDIKALNWEKCYFMTKRLITYLYNEFEFLREKLNKKDLSDFDKVWLDEEGADWENSLKNLLRYLYEYYNKKVVVLIDEYDAPLVSAYHNKYYEKAKDFFKTFYSSVLKDNPYLQMGVMTGIIRVIKAGIFSDLNNLNTYTILSDFYPNCYGLTEEEVKKSLIDYNLEYEMGDVKDWYDGYRFGKSEVYNPWSILNFLHAKELRAYWVDTSGNDLINDVLKIVRKDIIRDLKKLFDGEGLKQNLSGTSDLSRLLSEEEIWELMLFSGYLTVEEKIDEDYYILRLPNKEVRRLFKRTFIEKYFGRGNKLIDLMEALTENRIEDYEETLQDILLKSVSYNDTKKGNEAFYHGFILGMSLYLEGEYIVKSNIESGLGRYDVSIEPKNKNKRGYILEFKATDNVDKLEEISKEALKQIEEGKYSSTLRQTNTKEILYLGIAFCGKQIKVSYK